MISISARYVVVTSHGIITKTDSQKLREMKAMIINIKSVMQKSNSFCQLRDC